MIGDKKTSWHSKWTWLGAVLGILHCLSTPTAASPFFRNAAFAINTPPPSATANVIETTTSNNTTNSSSAVILIPEWKQKLPAPLNNKTKTLQRILVPGPRGVVEVYLLGTAHVSIDSSRDVRLLLETIQPNVIFLELCDQRIPIMMMEKPDNTTTIEEEPKGNFWKRRKQRRSQKQPEKGKNSMYAMASNLLTSMQQDYAGSLGVELGGEFRVAYEYWDLHRQTSPLHMILGDRPLYLTLTRAWESLGIWGKTKLVFGLLLSSLQKPNPEELKAWMQSILSDDNGDLLTESIAELAEHFPSLEEVIIKERDAYMACKLYQTCRQLLTTSQQQHQRHRLVAIVGAGHVEGMCRWLTTGNHSESPEEILARLIQIKKGIPDEDRRILVQDVMEVNHELLQATAHDEV
jgi:pheromone shutdown protein TraB